MDNFVTVLCILGIALLIGIVLFLSLRKSESEQKYYQEKREQEEQYPAFIRSFNEITANTSVPTAHKKVNFENGDANLLRTEQYMWIDKKDLCFFPSQPLPLYKIDSNSVNKIILFKIPLDKIEYYSIDGEVAHYTNISGGGGGGSSIGGAIAGGLIAGDTGAIIGSRKKISPIKSQLGTHDNRRTVLYFYDDNGEKRKINLDVASYDKFNELLPEKSFDIVNTIKTKNILRGYRIENNPIPVSDQIRELGKLRDEGLLTEQEFVEKKKSLLDKLG